MIKIHGILQDGFVQTYRDMRDAFYACETAKVQIPKQVLEFFGDSRPLTDEALQQVAISAAVNIEFNNNSVNVFTVDIDTDKLPPAVTKVVVTSDHNLFSRKYIGLCIKKYREAHTPLSQAGLAAQLEQAPSYVCNLESGLAGMPSAKKIKKIAGIFNTDPLTLLGIC